MSWNLYDRKESENLDPDFQHPIQIALVNLTEAIADVAQLLAEMNRPHFVVQAEVKKDEQK